MSPIPYNLARFDFVSIRLAVACARTGNLTQAARECHLVLPAASRRLRDLERSLGAAFRASFARAHPHRLGPGLYEAGARYLARARQPDGRAA
ncbi:helix-turn-helix domain-containing protein [Ideonella paludis]|uniref:helix-turn-helix domain-containing protein n=1 Tax=Ideonella paludis TaxID=1233411 RepID=UPI00363ADBB1